MLPWDKPKGRAAFKRLRCYVGLGDLKQEDLKDIKKFNHNIPLKYLTIKQITKLM